MRFQLGDFVYVEMLMVRDKTHPASRATGVQVRRFGIVVECDRDDTAEYSIYPYPDAADTHEYVGREGNMYRAYQTHYGPVFLYKGRLYRGEEP